MAFNNNINISIGKLWDPTLVAGKGIPSVGDAVSARRLGSGKAIMRPVAYEGRIMFDYSEGTNPVFRNPEQSGQIPRPPLARCSSKSDCASDYICVNGECEYYGEIGSNDGANGIVGPGDCDLPPAEGPINTPCNDSDGVSNCTEEAESGCGKPINDDGTLNCCGGEVYSGFVLVDGVIRFEQSCDGPVQVWDSKCDPFVDEYYKANGELPQGSSEEFLCSSCQECFIGVCEEYSRADNPPCYCNASDCEGDNGPCFECNEDTGECEETCRTCEKQIKHPFICPCDREGTRYEAVQRTNPCNPVGGGWAEVAEEIESFCNSNHPCSDPNNKCLGDCKTLTNVGSPPSCPSGNKCRSLGSMTNEATGQTTFLLESCEVKDDCGCAASPDSPSFLPCGSCEICEDNECVPDPSCVQSFGDGGVFEVEWYEVGSVKASCTLCNGTRSYSCQSIQGNTIYVWIYGCLDNNDYTSQPLGECVNKVIRRQTFSSSDSFSFSFNGSSTVKWDCSGISNSNLVSVPAGEVLYERRQNIYSVIDGRRLGQVKITTTGSPTLTSGSTGAVGPGVINYTASTVSVKKISSKLPPVGAYYASSIEGAMSEQGISDYTVIQDFQ